jgi:hypothetical protein
MPPNAGLQDVRRQSMATERWVVGPEHDDRLFRRLGAALTERGFKLGAEWEGVAGSQDISHWEAHSTQGALTVESETYVGLSVEGPSDLVGLVRERFGGDHAF